MNQRGVIPITLIVYAVIVLATAGAIYAAFRYVDGRLRAHYQAPIIAKWDADKAAWKKKDDERIAFQAALTVELSGKLMEAKDAAARLQGEIHARFSGLQERARRLPPATVAVSGAAARVFDDAAAAANAGRASPVAGAETRAVPVPAAAETKGGTVIYDEREFAAWVVQAGLAYSDAYALWSACRERENHYLAAILKGAP